MYANKKSSGWILCPSKTFPGKFYYFNMMNGEAAWSVSDVEKRTMVKNNYSQRVTDKWHGYHEPDSPPMEENPVSFQSWSLKRPEYNVQKQDHYNRQFASQSTPMLGQVLSEPYVPNMWPGQMPRPMIATPKRPSELALPWEAEREQYFQNPERVQPKSFDKPSETHENFFNGNFCVSSPVQNQSKWTFSSQNNSRLAFAPMQSNPRAYNQSMNRHVFRPKQNYSAPVFQNKPQLEFAQKPVLRDPIFNRVVTQSESQCNNRRNENIFWSPFGVNSRAPANDNICHRLSDFNQNSFKSEPITNRTGLRSVQNTDDSACLDLSNRLQSGLSFSNLAQNFRNKNFTITKPSESLIAGNLGFQPRCVQKGVQYSVQVADDNEAFDKARKRTQSATITEDVGDELDKGDLRYTLLAKRRKSVDIGELQKRVESADRKINLHLKIVKFEATVRSEQQSSSEKKLTKFKGRSFKCLNVLQCKKIKTHYAPNNKPVVSKKRVSFNLDSGIEESGLIEENFEEQTNYQNSETNVSIKTLRGLADPPVTTNWYIVADTEALLEDYAFLEAFVLTDDKCILLIPLAVRREVEALSVGDSQGRQRVLSARQLSRRLAAPPGHVAVQLAEEVNTAGMTVEDSVLQCCLQATMNDEYHVVLLTNDEHLYKKAESMEIYCFSLQSIKDEAAIEKPEVSFDLQKLPTITKNVENLTAANETSTKIEILDNNLSLQFKNDFNPFVSNKNEIPVNCFRKRLFDERKDENIVNPFLFQRKNDFGASEKRATFQKSQLNLKTPADREKTESKRVFAPNNLQTSESLPSEPASDVLNNTFSGLQRFSSLTSIEPLYREANTTQNTNIDFFRSHTSTEQFQNRIETEKSIQQNVNGNPCVNIPEEITCHTFNDIDIRNINSYTLDEHLKMFQVKTERTMERIKGKIEEWICSYTQIMEETLSDILQSSIEPRSSRLPPPWSLPEAVECVREVFSRHVTATTVVEKLSALLFNCSCKKGKLKNTTKPNDFMKILGCGVLLVQCLKNVLPHTPSLLEAETSLSCLLKSILDPSTDLEPPLAPPTLRFRDSDERDAREKSNFVKTPSDIIQYLEKHFSGWQSYGEDLANRESFQPKTNRHRESLEAFKLKPKPIENKTADHSNLTTGTANGAIDPEAKDLPRITRTVSQNHKETGPVEKESGAKLLKKLAINSGRLKTKLKDVNLEMRDKVNKELTSMIDNIVSGNVCSAAIIDAANKPGNKDGNDNIVADSNQSENGPQIIRKFHFSSMKKPAPAQTAKNVEKNAIFDSTDTPKRKECVGPKLIRKKKTIDNTEDQKKNGMLDLDALDYSDFDDNRENDNENKNIASRNDDNEHLVNDNSRNETQANEPNLINGSNQSENGPQILRKFHFSSMKKPAPAQTAKNVEKNAIFDSTDTPKCNYARVNDNGKGSDLEFDTTNDSGIEDDSQQAYLIAKSFLVEFSSSFKAIYRFIQSCGIEFREKDILDVKRRYLHRKAKWIQSRIGEIIANLKRIIGREASGAATLFKLMARARAPAATDKRVVRYKQVVTKCLEQAQLLADALRATLSLTDADCDAFTDTVSSNMKYYNMFE